MNRSADTTSAQPTTRHGLRSLLSAALTALLVLAGVSFTAAPAHAAVGDVAAATLDWGIKSSFTGYITSPVAQGGWTVTGDVTESAPFHWASGSGTASQTGQTGSVGYGGSIHFVGHDGALDLTFSDFRVERDTETSARIVIDAVYADMDAPGDVTSVEDITFATLDLASATNASDSTSVAFSAAPAILTEAGAAAFAGFYGAGTALDPVSFSWPVEQPPLPPVPTISVSKSTELHPGGETITVTGTGFDPQPPATTGTRAPLAGLFGGAYVVFGKFPDTWKPSEGVASSLRKVADQKWIVNPENTNVGAQAVAIEPDGSFSVELFVQRGYPGEPATGNYGIYTYSGSGASYLPFETYTPLSFSTAPTVSVSQTTELDPLGDTVTVQGWNFGPNPPSTTGVRPPLAGKFGGAYVVFGSFPDLWQPSAAVPSSARKVIEQTWVLNPEDLGIGASTVPINPDGTFSVTLDVQRDLAIEAFGGNYGIYTYPGSGASHAPFETATPISFTAAAPTAVALTASPSTGLLVGGTTTLRAQVSPAVPGTVTFRNGSLVLGSSEVDASGLATVQLTGLAEGTITAVAEFVPDDVLRYSASSTALTLSVAKPALAAGSLTWGIKDSFRDYVTGSIAHGSISITGIGTSGGAFVFGQGTGGSFD
ncbi:MAG: HtaA domain-containing protein, partial [Actinomycetota bacterium]|nr:HtaA domain-containing protein [Actinomycetota bacterium]